MMMRRFFAAVAIAAALLLAVVQVASDAAFGPLAEPGSLPGWLGRTIGLALLERIDASVSTPWSRTTLAQAALVRHDAARARAAIAGLAPGTQRDELDARLALLDGDEPRALAAFLAAGDANNVFPVVDRLARRGDLAAAIALDEQLVAQLQRDPTHPANYVDALIKLGQLHYAAARADRTVRAGELRSALAAYDRARDLQPIDVTLLIGIGDARYVLGDRAGAEAAYAQAMRLDPRDERTHQRPARIP